MGKQAERPKMVEQASSLSLLTLLTGKMPALLFEWLLGLPRRSFSVGVRSPAITGASKTVEAIVDRVPRRDVHLSSTANEEAVHLLLLTHGRQWPMTAS